MQWPPWKREEKPADGEKKDRWGGSAPVEPSAAVKPVERIVSSAPVRPSAAVKPVESQARVMDERGLQNSTFQIPDAKPKTSAEQAAAKPLPQASMPGERMPLTRAEVMDMIERAVPACVRMMSIMPPEGDATRTFVSPIGNALGYRTLEPEAGGMTLTRFIGTVTDEGLEVSAGCWTRNGTPVEFAGETVAAGADDFVWVRLTAAANDPALIPDDMVLESGSSRPDAEGDDGVSLVLGKLTAGVWEQYHTGGDVDDWMVVPDADQNMDGNYPIRNTLERNPEDTTHKGELQLYDVDTVAVETGAIPFFQRDTTPGNLGQLRWAAIDSQDPFNTPVQVSLGLAAGTGAQYRLQIHAFDTALDQQMLIVAAWPESPYPRLATWVYAMLLGGDPKLSGTGAGAVGSAYYTELLRAAGLAVDGTDLVLTVQQRKLEVQDGRGNVTDTDVPVEAARIALSSLLAAHTHATGDLSDWAEAFRHDELNDMPSADNADHDGRYLRAEEKDPLGGPTSSNFATTGALKAGGIWIGGREMELVRMAVVDPNTGESTEREVLAVKL